MLLASSIAERNSFAWMLGLCLVILQYSSYFSREVLLVTISSDLECVLASRFTTTLQDRRFDFEVSIVDIACGMSLSVPLFTMTRRWFPLYFDGFMPETDDESTSTV